MQPVTITPVKNVIVESLCRHTVDGSLQEPFSQEQFSELTGWSLSETRTVFSQLVTTGQLIQQGEEYSWSKKHNAFGNILSKIVTEAPGIKDTKLAAEFVKQAFMVGLPTPDIAYILNFATSGGIVEVQYTLPHSLSSESLYFPKGTSIRSQEWKYD